MDRMDAIAWTVPVRAGYLRLSQASSLGRNWWRRPWAWCGVHWRDWAGDSQTFTALPPSTLSPGCGVPTTGTWPCSLLIIGRTLLDRLKLNLARAVNQLRREVRAQNWG